MDTSKNVTSYLTSISHARSKIVAVDEKVDGSELVRITVNGATKPWIVFVEAIVARENLPSWDRLWDDFMQEETRRGLVQGSSSNGKEEEVSVALSATSKKSKKGPKGGAKQQRVELKKDPSRVGCYACNAFGHYAGQCPNKKRGKQEEEHVVATVEIESFVAKFEK